MDLTREEIAEKLAGVPEELKEDFFPLVLDLKGLWDIYKNAESAALVAGKAVQDHQPARQALAIAESDQDDVRKLFNIAGGSDADFETMLAAADDLALYLPYLKNAAANLNKEPDDGPAP